ncbi:PREDICTED: uncharacterized protein LOC104607635 [Nelumbo nucifera]|nr:PREDICTED: uncharacterized protein LOC104607635 [Nelumbo nucifera]
MALSWGFFALVLIFALSGVEPSACHQVKGSVSCLDCTHHESLSGLKVVVKCDKVKKLSMATTDNTGSFETELPTDSSVPSSNCLAKLLGGPRQLCSYKKNLVSKIVKAHETDAYTISTPLNFYTSCSQESKNPSSPSSSSSTQTPEIGSSKTINIPLPPEWGLAPSSYYFPFLPIIGIP